MKAAREVTCETLSSAGGETLVLLQACKHLPSEGPSLSLIFFWPLHLSPAEPQGGDHSGMVTQEAAPSGFTGNSG